MTAPSEAKLYVIPASHPCRAAMLMLEHKRIPFRPIELGVIRHPLTVRARGFRGRTVPALRIDRQRAQTNRQIARLLERLRPDPPLFPADSRRRAAVEEAERWADEVLQPMARRILLAAVMRDGLDALSDRGDSGNLGYLLYRSARMRRAMVGPIGRYWGAAAKQGQDLLDLPAALDRIDSWLAEGILGAERSNAAGLQTAPSIALLLYVRNLRPQIETRPVGSWAERLVTRP